MEVFTYSAWYELPEHQVRDLRALFITFDANVAPLQPAQIVAGIASSDETRLTYVMLEAEGRVRVLHRVRQYPQLIERRLGAADLIVTAMRDETRDLGPTFVEFPGEAFHRTDVLANAWTYAAANAARDVHPEAQLAVDAGAQGIRAARSRHVMLVPPMVAGQVLLAASRPEGLYPRDLWQEVAAPLYEDDEIRDAVLPFLDWCCIAYTQGQGENNPLQLAALVPVNLSPYLLEKREALYRRDLPARFRPFQQVAPAEVPVVQALGRFQEAWIARDEANAEREEQREAAAIATPSKRWPRLWTRLLKLCGVPEEADLPPMWLELAKSNTKKDRAMIQHCLEDFDEDFIARNGGDDVEPICSGELAKHLGSLTFHSSIHTIDTGITIFAVSHPDEECIASVAAAAAIYDQQMLGVGNINLEESVKLKEQMAFRLPTNYSDVKHVCWCYLRLLAAVLGVDHQVTAAFGAFARVVSSSERRHRGELDGNQARCAGFLRCVQVEMHPWLSETLKGQFPVPPNFLSIIMDLVKQKWICPTLPAKYLVPKKTPPVLPADPPRNAADNKVVAPPEHLDRELIPYIKNFRVGAFIKKYGRPPKGEQGKELCPGYHVIGECYANCRRKGGHVKHSPMDGKRMAEYLAQGK